VAHRQPLPQGKASPCHDTIAKATLVADRATVTLVPLRWSRNRGSGDESLLTRVGRSASPVYSTG
jgi:hypothetical protein